jgi:predicted MFS family arabinose efflux permease
MDNFSFSLCLACVSAIHMVAYVVAPLLDVISPEFNIKSNQLGWRMSIFFYLPGLLGALVFGWLTSTTNRKSLVLLISLITAGGALMCSFPKTIETLLIMRTITGFGYGGIIPVTNSLLADWFPPEQRTSKAGALITVQGIGIFIGHQIGDSLKDFWQIAFVFTGVPILLLGFLYYKYANEPVMGASDLISDYNQVRVDFNRQLKILQSRTNYFMFQISFPGNIASGVLMMYLSSHLRNTLKMSSWDSSLGVTALGIGFLLGSMTGGWLGSHLYHKNVKIAICYCSFTCTARALPAIFLISWGHVIGENSCAEWLFFILLMLGFLSAQHGAVTTAILMNVNLPQNRGIVAAICSSLDDVSKSLGLLIFSVLVDQLGGFIIAFHFVLIFWILSGLLVIPVTQSYHRDMLCMQNILQEASDEAKIKDEVLNTEKSLLRKLNK